MLARPSPTAAVAAADWFAKRWAAVATIPQVVLLEIAPASAGQAAWGRGALTDALNRWSDSAGPARAAAPAAASALLDACVAAAKPLSAGKPAARDSVQVAVDAIVALDLGRIGSAEVSLRPSAGGAREVPGRAASWFGRSSAGDGELADGVSAGELRAVAVRSLLTIVAQRRPGSRKVSCEARLPLRLELVVPAESLAGFADMRAVEAGWTGWRPCARVGGAWAQGSWSDDAARGFLIDVDVCVAAACVV